MPYDQEQLKREVMSRVRFIWLVRRLATPLGIQSGIFGISALALFYSVSVSHVFLNVANLPGYNSYIPYIYNAFMHTTFSVQFLTVLLFLAVISTFPQLIHKYYPQILQRRRAGFV